jgi:Flp pilus assembly protein TadG
MLMRMRLVVGDSSRSLRRGGGSTHGARTGSWAKAESGTATVEFALILAPLLALVFGIIFFGIGLYTWLDINRVANQGARQAVVNHWPTQCARGATCNTSNASTACSTVLATSSRARLQDVLRCRTKGVTTVCFPGKAPATATIGDPVTIKIRRPYTLFFMKRFTIQLKASATMRLEQAPQASLTTGSGGPTCT